MSKLDNPLLRINNTYDSMFNKEKSIADLILKDPNKVMYLTVKEMANEAQTSESSIVRFCKQLGYSGYTELKLEIAKSSFSYSDNEKSKSDNNEDNYDAKKLLTQTVSLLKDLVEKIDYQEIDKAVKAINDSDLVLIYGNNESGELAHLFAHKLKSIGKPTLISSTKESMKQNNFMLNKSTVAIFISNSGSSNEPLKGILNAKNNNAKSIVLTKSKESKLAKFSDILIEVPFFKTHLLEYYFPTQIAFQLILSVIANELIESNEVNTQYMLEYRNEITREAIENSIE